MNTFVVFATLLVSAMAAPQVLVNTVNEGRQSGPLTPLVGNLVQTPKGLRDIELEGFSEDLDQDGFVDPVVPAVPAPVVVPQPLPAPVVVPQPLPAPIATPVFRTPFFNPAPIAVPSAPVVRTVAFNPAPVVRTVAAPAPIFNPVAAPVFKTISPLPVAVRAAPSAVTFESRRFF